MALSTELKNHLYNKDGNPFEKRLKLAENAFTSPDFIVSRKEDIILGWLCEKIKKNTDNSVPWRILNDCINYQNNHSHSMNLKAPIKSTLIQTLSHGLDNLEDDKKNQHNAEFILQCCRSILIDSSEMQKSFISNPDLYIDILSKLLIKKNPPNQEDTLEHPQQLSIIIEAVEKLIKYQRQSQDKEKIQYTFINNLLNSLSTYGQKNLNNRQLQSTIIKSIEKIVFDKFDEQFEAADKLFEILSSKINKVQDDETAIAVSVYVFKASINLNKLSSSSSTDFVYRKLLKFPTNLLLKIKICKELNECLVNTSLNMKNEIEGVTLLDYQSSIISEILSMNIFEPSAYTCLASFAKLNPLVIETKLSDVFKRILLEKKTTNEDKNSYESLMVDIFDACVRLRRDKKLVSSILMSLDESLTERKIKLDDFEEGEILPDEFIDKFTLSVRSMTSSQVTSVLMSFNHHLGLILSVSERDIISLKVMRQLFIAFIEGVQIADSSWLQPVQQKFVNNLVDLGKTLGNLSQIIHEKSSEFNGNISVYILSMTESWITLIGLFKHYAPDSVPEDIVHNVMEILKTVNKFINPNETSLTKKLEFFCKFQENRIRDKSNLFYKLIKNENVFDDFGGYLLKEYPHGILHLDKSQILNLAVYLLKDLGSSVELISMGVVRNNRDLVAALILETFKGIASRLGDDSESTTKKLMNKIERLDCWEDGTIKKQLKHQKKQLANPSWMMIKKKKILSGIEEYLRVLLSLPLMHCSDKLKIFTFLLGFSLKNECPINSESRNLCIKILLDITEACTFDVLQYIPLNIFLQDLSDNFEIIVTRSLINSSNYEAITNLIEENSADVEIGKLAVVLVECLEKSKPKLKPDDKQVVQKIEKKLQKIMINNLDNGINNVDELKCLTFVIKLTVTRGKKIEDDSLVKIIQSALDSLIGENKVNDLETTKEGHQFIKVVIQYKASGITLDDKSIKNIWTSMMKKSCEDIVPSLIELTDPKILGVVLNLLQKKIMNSLKDVNEDNEILFENYLSIWYSIIKSEMGANRATIRRSSLHGFLQSLKSTKIPYVNSYKNILKLCTMITSSIRMHINEKTVDLILQLVNNIINESMSINNCQQVLQLCSGFLKYRMSMIADRLPCLLLLFKKSIKFTIDESRVNTINQHKITLLTLEINKISSALIKMKKDIARLSPYLIADLVSYYADSVIPFYVKESIDESVGLFFSICDQHAISLLNRVLPVSMQEIFKSLYDNYNKFNKFTGKI